MDKLLIKGKQVIFAKGMKAAANSGDQDSALGKLSAIGKGKDLLTAAIKGVFK